MNKTQERMLWEDPHNEDLESYCLAMAFKNTPLADEVIANLTEDDFYEDFNDRVFKAIKQLRFFSQAVSSISVEMEIRGQFQGGAEIPFDAPDRAGMKRKYARFFNYSEDGLPDAFRRLKRETHLRKIVYAAQETIAAARLRETEPLECFAPLDALQADLLHENNRVIIWADEAERRAQETYDDLDAGRIVAIPTGFPEIDKILYGGGMWKGDYFVVSGATSGGKTTLALNFMDNAAEQGYRDLYFSLEMKVFKVFARVHSRKARIPAYKIRPFMSERGGLDKGKTIRERLRESGGEVGRLPFGIVDTVKDMEMIKKIAKLGVSRYDVNRIIIDYEGLAVPSKRFRGGRYERATAVSDMCKEIATDLDIPVIGLNQLRRKTSQEKALANDGLGTQAGNEVEPDLEMLKESGAIENNADTILFVWGERGKEGETEGIRDVKFKIAKQRNGGLGRGLLHFAPDIFNFASPSELQKMLDAANSIDF